MNPLHLDFLGVAVKIFCNSEELQSRLQLDFAAFVKISPTPNTGLLIVRVHLGELPKNLIPEELSIAHSLSAITYEKGPVRINDYHGEAVSRYDRSREEADIYSPHLHRLHEITFLFILSRVEKTLDLKGYHKIHACGVSQDGTALIIQMPMKGGKTTLFTHLIDHADLKIISDDTPVIGRTGRAHAFPVRMGIEKLPPHWKLPAGSTTELLRKQYGKKTLVDVTRFSNGISPECSQIILCHGIRTGRQETRIIPCSRWEMLVPTIKNLVVGIGLPMVIEHFLESGIRDGFKRLRIALSRTQAMLFLLARSRCYRIELGRDPKKAADLLAELLTSAPKSQGLDQPVGRMPEDPVLDRPIAL